MQSLFSAILNEILNIAQYDVNFDVAYINFAQSYDKLHVKMMLKILVISYFWACLNDKLKNRFIWMEIEALNKFFLIYLSIFGIGFAGYKFAIQHFHNLKFHDN